MIYQLEPDTRQDLHLGHLGIPWNALDDKTLRNVITAAQDELRARAHANPEGDPMTVTTDLPAKTNAQRIDDVIDMLDLATAGESVSTSCVENARASAEVLRGEIKAGR